MLRRGFFLRPAVFCAVAFYTTVGPGDLGEKMVLSGRLDVKSCGLLLILKLEKSLKDSFLKKNIDQFTLA